MSRVPPDSGLELQPLMTRRSSFDHPQPPSPDIICTNAAADRDSRHTRSDRETKHGSGIQAASFGDTTQDTGQRDRASGDIKTQGDMKNNPPANATWQPTWLRHGVFAAFFGLFSAMAVAISALLSYSDHNDGVSEIRQSFAYGWRFGPTIVLTIVAALWARVELQAMRYMPAIAISADEEHHEHTYSLDYISLLYPKAIFRAIRQKHHLVYLTSCISILLKAQVALAPGLFNLIDVQIETSASTYLLDSFDITENFSEKSSSQGRGDVGPYYITRAIRDFDMLYPFGVTSNIAYQTFGVSDRSLDGSRGTTEAPLKVNVDGVFVETLCRKLERLSFVNVTFPPEGDISDTDNYDPSTIYKFDLFFEGCHEALTLAFHLNNTSDNRTYIWEMATDSQPARCPPLPNHGSKLIYFAGLLNTATSHRSHIEFSTAAAIVCSPIAWLQQVQVTDDGINPRVKLLPNARKSPVAADIWALTGASFPAGESLNILTSDGILGPLKLDRADGKMIDPLDTSIYDSEILLNSTVDLFRNMGPFVIHYNLRQSSDIGIMTKGALIQTKLRLSLTRRVGVSMIAVFCTITLLDIILLLRYSGMARLAIRCRNPATIFGHMVFHRQHEGLASGVRKYTAALRSDKFNTSWATSSYLPLVLRSVTRALVATFLFSLIACVVTTQRLSDSSHGLTTLNLVAENNMHLLWTLIPALVLLLVSLYTSSCAMALRILHSFWLPTSKTRDTTELDRSLLDMLSIRALYRSTRLGAHGVTVSQFLALACAILTTLSSVLLTTEEFTSPPRTTNLRRATRFGTQPLNLTRDPVETRKALSSLLLRRGANFTYPRNTYRDLVFPSLKHGNLDSPDGAMNSINLADLPAAQISSQCTRLTVDRIDSMPSKSKDNVFGLSVPCICSNGTRFHWEYWMDSEAAKSNETQQKPYYYFGFSVRGRGAKMDLQPGCQPGLNRNSLDTPVSRKDAYIWGAYSLTEQKFASLSAWQCSYEWYEVSTNTSLRLVDGELEVDPTWENSPRPDYSSLKPGLPAFGIPDPLYPSTEGQNMATTVFPEAVFDGNSTDLLDQVAILVQPYGPFPMESLGDAYEENAILAELCHDFGLAAAQLANVENRIAINETSTEDSPPELPQVRATISYKPQLRLVQNAGPAYAIVAILSAVLLANLWSLCSAGLRRFGGTRERLFLDMDVRGVAPEDSGSFAAMACLLRDSNVYDHLPSNIESLSDAELHGMLSHLRFRMGWFQSKDGSKTSRHFTIGVLDDPNTVFLGGKRDMAETDDKGESTMS